MAEYFSPWKEFMDPFLKPFMEFGFLDLHDAIDRPQPVVALDKELQQIALVSDVDVWTVDKLVEVRLHDGTSTSLLIHVEVQSQRMEKFAERMFVCYESIRGMHDREGEEAAGPIVCGIPL